MHTSTILAVALSAFALAQDVEQPEQPTQVQVDNPATPYLTETNDLGVVTGQPDAATSQPDAVLTQPGLPPLVTEPAGSTLVTLPTVPNVPSGSVTVTSGSSSPTGDTSASGSGSESGSGSATGTGSDGSPTGTSGSGSESGSQTGGSDASATESGATATSTGGAAMATAGPAGLGLGIAGALFAAFL